MTRLRCRRQIRPSRPWAIVRGLRAPTLIVAATGSTRASIKLIGSATTAIWGGCNECSGVTARSLIVDGSRKTLGAVSGAGALLEFGGTVSGQTVRDCQLSNPRGWSCLHFIEYAEPAVAFLDRQRDWQHLQGRSDHQQRRRTVGPGAQHPAAIPPPRGYDSAWAMGRRHQSLCVLRTQRTNADRGQPARPAPSRATS